MPSLEPPRYLIGESPAFEPADLDRAAGLRSDATAVAELWSDPRARVLVVQGGRALIGEAGLVMVPPAEAPDGERLLMGVGEDGPVFAVHPQAALRDPRAQGIRGAAGLVDPTQLGLLLQAIALANWHETHPRCARCGAATELVSAGYARRCPVDATEHYPRTDPAVIVLVVDGEGGQADRCLLGRQASWPESRFSTLAGFVEPGETLEQAVAREVAEEVGVEVASVSYAGSQPWPFPASLMLAYYAVAAQGYGTDEALVVDGEEIVEARWFDRAGLAAGTESGEVLVPPHLSVARRLIEGWFGGRLSAQGTWR